MTSTPSQLDALTLRSPDALVCAIPYLLGFHPTDSAVLVWLSDGRILLTQRLNLPRRRRDLVPWQQAAWSHPAAEVADEIVVLLACAPAYAHVEEVSRALVATSREHSVAVRDLILFHDGRWRSLLCSDDACCPEEGRPVDPAVEAFVAAEFTVLGRAPLADRAELARCLESDASASADLAERAGRICASLDRRDDSWRDEAIVALTDQLLGAPSPTPPRPDQVAGLLVSLADIRVRDTVLWELGSVGPDRVDIALDRAIALLRTAPTGWVAPVATCVAVLAWLSGDGARATMAIERARADDPGYPLAALVGTSLAVGLAPAAWRSAMAGLTRDQCRFGTARA